MERSELLTLLKGELKVEVKISKEFYTKHKVITIVSLGEDKVSETISYSQIGDSISSGSDH